MKLTVRKIFVVAIVLMASLLGFVLISIFRTSSTVTVGRSTTVITTPLRSDGLPDIPKHLFEMQRQGVTPENNAAVLIWRATWPGELNEDDHVAFCDAMGIVPMPTEDESLKELYSPEMIEAIDEWLKSRNATQSNAEVGTDDGTDDIAASDEAATDETGPDEANPEEAIPEEANPDDEIGESEDDGEYVVDTGELTDYSAYGVVVDSAQLDADTLIGLLYARPWSSEDVPLAAQWIADNQAPFDLIFEASKRPRYFSVSPTYLKQDDELLLLQLMPGVHGMRGCARSLSIRSMWHLGEGRVDEAWEDTMANLRLSRLAGQGPTLIHQLVAYAMDAIALRSANAIICHESVTLEQAERMLSDLNNLSAQASMKKAIDVTERMMFVDFVLALARGRDVSVSDLTGGGGPDFQLPRGAADWDLVLENANAWYDRIVAAAEIPDRQQRLVALEQIDLDVQQLAMEVKSPANLAKAVVSSKQRSKLIGDTMVAMFLPAVNAATAATDRTSVLLDLSRVAAALRVYRARTGEYPKSLDALTPEIMPSVPNDLYTETPFRYERREAGFLLYSVGKDGVDNRGSDASGEILNGEWLPQGQEASLHNGEYDHVIREPRPALELPEPTR